MEFIVVFYLAKSNHVIDVLVRAANDIQHTYMEENVINHLIQYVRKPLASKGLSWSRVSFGPTPSMTHRRLKTKKTNVSKLQLWRESWEGNLSKVRQNVMSGRKPSIWVHVQQTHSLISLVPRIIRRSSCLIKHGWSICYHKMCVICYRQGFAPHLR